MIGFGFGFDSMMGFGSKMGLVLWTGLALVDDLGRKIQSFPHRKVCSRSMLSLPFSTFDDCLDMLMGFAW